MESFERPRSTAKVHLRSVLYNLKPPMHEKQTSIPPTPTHHSTPCSQCWRWGRTDGNLSLLQYPYCHTHTEALRKKITLHSLTCMIMWFIFQTTAAQWDSKITQRPLKKCIDFRLWFPHQQALSAGCALLAWWSGNPLQPTTRVHRSFVWEVIKLCVWQLPKCHYCETWGNISHLQQP